MKKLLFLALVVFAAWYGWHHYGDVFTKLPTHEAVIVNNSGHRLQRIRLKVDGQTFVKEELAQDEKVAFPFHVKNDASFALTFQFADRMGDNEWKGGMVPKGPMVQRHTMTVDPDAQVIYQPENK